ncbi:hypothetical protein R5R73_04750 [Salinicola sp. LHM]|uniref:hypothetical protein n=1 Tax=Salinicola sp. LHM TaxID=3065298 RepID=UPI002ACEBB38|nr:hypothetical protein [Salinicola sp. LHM]WQH33998.1 hypothetical protein R5R73_04750 [Salinicola sp. LHM]
MSFAAHLRERLGDAQTPPVSGTWRPISLCLDDVSGEFLNVGIAFQHQAGIEVRMLDTFHRLQCLYDKRIERNQLQHLLMDIEETLIRHPDDRLPDSLADTIRLGQPAFAQGENPEAIIDAFFHDIVTLARPRPGAESDRFRYRSTPKIRAEVLDGLYERMGILADKVIQLKPSQIPLRNGRQIEVDVPLMSKGAAGTIASAWYKNPMVVENTILRAESDLMHVASNTGRRPILSILLPSSDSGLTHKERERVERAADRKLGRMEFAGCKIIRDDHPAGLIEQTYDVWWREAA